MCFTLVFLLPQQPAQTVPVAKELSPIFKHFSVCGEVRGSTSTLQITSISSVLQQPAPEHRWDNARAVAVCVFLGVLQRESSVHLGFDCLGMCVCSSAVPGEGGTYGAGCPHGVGAQGHDRAAV